MQKDKRRKLMGPLIFQVISIFSGSLGITFTLTNLSIPALTFDSISLFSAVLSAFRGKNVE